MYVNVSSIPTAISIDTHECHAIACKCVQAQKKVEHTHARVPYMREKAVGHTYNDTHAWKHILSARDASFHEHKAEIILLIKP